MFLCLSTAGWEHERGVGVNLHIYVFVYSLFNDTAISQAVLCRNIG
jgi:hypothetical protein